MVPVVVVKLHRDKIVLCCDVLEPPRHQKQKQAIFHASLSSCSLCLVFSRWSGFFNNWNWSLEQRCLRRNHPLPVATNQQRLWWNLAPSSCWWWRLQLQLTELRSLWITSTISTLALSIPCAYALPEVSAEVKYWMNKQKLWRRKNARSFHRALFCLVTLHTGLK